jgi:hypothetical protein
MTHGIDLTNLQHTLPVMGLLVIGIFHLLNVLVTQISQFVMKGLEAIRGVAKKFRLMKRELRRVNIKGRTPAIGKSCGRARRHSSSSLQHPGKEKKGSSTDVNKRLTLSVSGKSSPPRSNDR